ncbi:hypothetical protein V1512DRAFT_254524 [Lipomyces arxii]|uniref:uncharacterized protein n=1 Tax=Lipomyces arxii TaxID=56418 RepID=UPI0034CFD360
MSSKVYRSLLRELEAWMSTATAQKPTTVSTILQQTLDMSAPPPQPPVHSSNNKLDLLHEQLRNVMRDHFKVDSENVDQDKAKQKVTDAGEILTYLRSQRTYKILLDRYNPTATLEDHERVRLTARRVGLELPKDIEKRIKEDETEDSEVKSKNAEDGGERLK